MKRFTMMALLAGLAFAGCGKSNDLVGKLQGFKDQMCACKPGDSACADKVSAAEEAWEKDAKKGDKPDSDTMKKLDELDHQMSDCEDKARGLDMGGGAATP
jgi:hypothetical protein